MNFGQRLLRSLGGAVPEISQATGAADADADERRAIDEQVRRHAEQGNAVIVGRVANAIVPPQTPMLRVFLYAPLAWRARAVAEQFALSDEAARAKCVRVDESRRSYASDYYGIEWGTTAHYDVLIDVARVGIDGAVEVIAAAVSAAES